MQARTNPTRRRLTTLVCCAWLAFALSACAPEVGSEAWCKKMQETPKGDWSANEAGDYAKNCLFT